MSAGLLAPSIPAPTGAPQMPPGNTRHTPPPPTTSSFILLGKRLSFTVAYKLSFCNESMSSSTFQTQTMTCSFLLYTSYSSSSAGSQERWPNMTMWIIDLGNKHFSVTFGKNCRYFFIAELG